MYHHGETIKLFDILVVFLNFLQHSNKQVLIDIGKVIIDIVISENIFFKF